MFLTKAIDVYAVFQSNPKALVDHCFLHAKAALLTCGCFQTHKNYNISFSMCLLLSIGFPET